ncbi:hypothetical protein DP114_04525 [Brasilonema sennae CENA114]|uniref:Uncharacterized protein n=2 Tax=Bromeliae group (in: Brasilonema) TaxID=3398495 RepID=A0A856ME89_9CYAN|nr:hypothetical protein DP114_04525 [Brasilonema sennae CENA114]
MRLGAMIALTVYFLINDKFYYLILTMTITLTMKEELELWAEADQNTLQNPEPHEFVGQIPRQLGTGYVRDIEVHPNLWLKILDYEYHDEVLIKIPDWDHPLQFHVLANYDPQQHSC